MISVEMNGFTFIILFLIGSDGSKTWISNTGVNNTLNWDGGEAIENCDNLIFPSESDVAAYWNIRDIAIGGLSLSMSGDIIFPSDAKLRFKDREKCSRSRDRKYTRTEVKGWLDPHNWKSDEGDSKWLPHSHRVPCAGERISFPPDNTIAVQLPTILLPVSTISFGNKVFEGEEWNNFLKSELGFQLFKGPQDARNYPWRTDPGCTDRKKCVCGRSAYTIRDGIFKDVNPRIFEEAVCLYAMPKCEPVKCFSPVVPAGHCCGICGAVIKLEDKTENGLDLADIESMVKEELIERKLQKVLKTYVGRTRDGDVQVVIIAEDSDATINSHSLSNILSRKLTDQKLPARITFHLSGLTFSKYMFNRFSGIVLGTLFSVLILFFSLFYVYVILPKKKISLWVDRPFVFARFDNTLNDENLEIDIKSIQDGEPSKAFDNPIYSESLDLCSSEMGKINETETGDSEGGSDLEKTATKEYHNPVYDDLQKSENRDVFNEEKIYEKVEEEFSEIKL